MEKGDQDSWQFFRKDILKWTHLQTIPMRWQSRTETNVATRKKIWGEKKCYTESEKRNRLTRKDTNKLNEFKSLGQGFSTVAG